MSTTLKDRLSSEMKAAMKNRDKDRLAVLRTILAAIKQIEVDERIIVDDARLLAILDKQLKQRRESAKIYQQAGREELYQQESFEMSVIQEFLPQALTEQELDQLITQAISSVGAQSMQEMGKVMGVLKPQVQGRADMGQVSRLIKSRLG